MANISKIYDKATEKEYMLADLGARNGSAIQKGAITPEKTSFGHILHKTSENIYNPDLQTAETISPHYYVSGKPYETMQFDNSYNCTAPISVDENTAYWLGLVPAVNGYTKPWADAGHGVFSTMLTGISSVERRQTALQRRKERYRCVSTMQCIKI
jgi:hypothetical protein